MGPFIVTADEIPNPQKLQIQTRVNGEVRQDMSTSQMIFEIAEVLVAPDGWHNAGTGRHHCDWDAERCGVCNETARFFEGGRSGFGEYHRCGPGGQSHVI